MMDGFLNIDKDAGITSFDVIRNLKKLLPPKIKIGHLGTLDPMATGVLPVAIGKATKLISYIEGETKAYITRMVLGGISDTQDAWGNITYTGKTSFDEDEFRLILDRHKGVIEQIPPMYSAVHHNGKRLYELAREGVVVDRQPRKVMIKEITILDIDKKDVLPSIKLYIECSRGTYIRTLCHDLGMQLATGAYMAELIRVRSGLFILEDAYKLSDLTCKDKLEEFILPLDYPLLDLDAYYLSSDKEIKAIKNGNSIKCCQYLPKTEKIRLYDGKNLLAIASLKKIDTTFYFKPEKVI